MLWKKSVNQFYWKPQYSFDIPSSDYLVWMTWLETGTNFASALYFLEIAHPKRLLGSGQDFLTIDRIINFLRMPLIGPRPQLNLPGGREQHISCKYSSWWSSHDSHAIYHSLSLHWFIVSLAPMLSMSLNFSISAIYLFIVRFVNAPQN